MRCKSCEYPLWNLLTRNCPECGEAFKPSDFRFSLNSVAYCCPHCSQRYYGTGEEGHLVPRQFRCVSCQQEIDMDEMLLLPTEGVDERLTRADVNPWLDQSTGFFKRWFSTLFRGVTTPMWLLRSTPVDADAANAWGFAMFTHLIIAIGAVLPVLLFLGIFALGTGAAAVGGLAGGGLLFTIGTVVASGVGLGLWTLTAHGMLRVGGPLEGGMGRTSQAFCYTCGPQLLLLVPCLAMHLSWLSLLWWSVTAGFALSAAQGVSGLRAAIAVAVFPICVFVLGAAWIIFMISGVATAATWSVSSTESVSAFQPGMSRMVAAGEFPQHGVQFLLDGDVIAGQYVSMSSMTTTDGLTVAGTALEDVSSATGAARGAILDGASSFLAIPGSAHRVGDFVFALDALAAGDANLWVVIEAWDPSKNSRQQEDIHVLLADGTTRRFNRGSMWSELTQQNSLRRGAGLPDLPDPFSVRGEPPPP